MKKKKMAMRIITSPIKVLMKVKDFYIRSITNCGNSMSYSNPMDIAGRFEALPRSFSTAVSSTTSDDNQDFAELVRAASAKTTLSSSMLQIQTEDKTVSSVLPKSKSVGMAKIDEDNPSDFSHLAHHHHHHHLPVVPKFLPNTSTVAVF